MGAQYSEQRAHTLGDKEEAYSVVPGLKEWILQWANRSAWGGEENKPQASATTCCLGQKGEGMPAHSRQATTFGWAQAVRLQTVLAARECNTQGASVVGHLMH